MKLKHIGFFKELKHGDEYGECLNASIRNEADKKENRIIQYLSSGSILCVSPGIVSDIFDDSKIIGELNIYTDGVWAWPSDLLYYIKEYHVCLSADFVMHIYHNNWVVPDFNEANLDVFEL